MREILIAAVSLVVGIALGIAFSAATIHHLRKRVRELRAGLGRTNVIRSITRFLFTTVPIFAIVWVTWTYVISTYATIELKQAFPAEELSAEAVRTILGVAAMKVVENVFEHNDGPIFGHTKQDEQQPPDAGQ